MCERELPSYAVFCRYCGQAQPIESNNASERVASNQPDHGALEAIRTSLFSPLQKRIRLSPRASGSNENGVSTRRWLSGVRTTSPRLSKMGDIVKISVDGLSKVERGAEAAVEVEHLADKRTLHHVAFKLAWKPKKVFGRVITGGLYDVRIGTPAAMYIQANIDPPNFPL
jgi:hypothetical protein